MEGEVLLHAVDGREVVVFDLAQLEEARGKVLVGTLAVESYWGCCGGRRGLDVLFAELGGVFGE